AGDEALAREGLPALPARGDELLARRVRASILPPRALRRRLRHVPRLDLRPSRRRRPSAGLRHASVEHPLPLQARVRQEQASGGARRRVRAAAKPVTRAVTPRGRLAWLLAPALLLVGGCRLGGCAANVLGDVVGETGDVACDRRFGKDPAPFCQEVVD